MNVRTEQHEHILVVTIDRPEARNAINLAMFALVPIQRMEAHVHRSGRIGRQFCRTQPRNERTSTQSHFSDS